MDLSWWRDLVIVIWGAITTAAVICICILACLLYKKLVPLVEDADIVVGKVGDVVDFTKKDKKILLKILVRRRASPFKNIIKLSL